MDLRLLNVDYYRGIKQRFLERPLRPVFAAFQRVGITPNHITVFGFLSGSLSLLFIGSNPLMYIAFTLLVLLSDGLDGLYARAINKADRKGHLFDKGFDFIGGLSVYIAAWLILDLPLAAVAGVFYTIANILLFVWRLDAVAGASCDFRIFLAFGLPVAGLYWDIFKFLVVFPVRSLIMRRRGYAQVS